MYSNSAIQVISFFFYVLVQGMLFQNMVLFDVAFCFAYVAFLLCLPVDMNRILLLLVGFVMGVSVDVFYDSLGMHASASVFVMFIRNYWLNNITPQSGYSAGSLPTIKLNGWQWFIGYIVPLVFAHHLVLFFIEASSFSLFWFTLSKVFMSTIFSVVIIFVIQFLFYNSRRT